MPLTKQGCQGFGDTIYELPPWMGGSFRLLENRRVTHLFLALPILEKGLSFRSAAGM